jgi:hypothetical protein
MGNAPDFFASYLPRAGRRLAMFGFLRRWEAARVGRSLLESAMAMAKLHELGGATSASNFLAGIAAPGSFQPIKLGEKSGVRAQVNDFVATLTVEPIGIFVSFDGVIRYAGFSFFGFIPPKTPFRCSLIPGSRGITIYAVELVNTMQRLGVEYLET